MLSQKRSFNVFIMSLRKGKYILYPLITFAIAMVNLSLVTCTYRPVTRELMERIQGVLDDLDIVSDITELVNQTGMCLIEEQTMAAAPVDSETRILE